MASLLVFSNSEAKPKGPRSRPLASFHPIILGGMRLLPTASTCGDESFHHPPLLLRFDSKPSGPHLVLDMAAHGWPAADRRPARCAVTLAASPRSAAPGAASGPGRRLARTVPAGPVMLPRHVVRPPLRCRALPPRRAAHLPPVRGQAS